MFLRIMTLAACYCETLVPLVSQAVSECFVGLRRCPLPKPLHWILAICLMFGVGRARAGTYYVAKDGNDLNAGTSSAPWKTIQKAANTLRAGDTVLVAPGDYDEHVYETTSGTPGQYITFKSSEPHAASLRAFRLGGQYIRVDSFKLSGYSGVKNTWGAAVRIESDAHNSVVTNCWISDAPYVIAHDFRFNHLNNEVVSLSSDFVAAGFMPGSKVFLGACGYPGFWYTNHDTSWNISSNTTTHLWLTNAAKEVFGKDVGSNYWAAILPGRPGTLYGVSCVRSENTSATNLLISGNTISNWMARGVNLVGRGSILENNYATKLGSYFLTFDGSDFIIRGNVVRKVPAMLHYNDDESAQLIHPPGTDWADFVGATIRGEAPNNTISRTNVLIERNWFEDIDDQMGRVNDEQPGTYGITYANNVFIGISMHFSGARDDMRWVSNTFYRCGYSSSGPLTLGGRPPAVTNISLLRNLFIDCGNLDRSKHSGWYSFSTNALNPIADFNMVAGAEITGYPGKENFFELHGINGGDPGFIAPLNPLGPDGIPFTSDDGLQVIPNSLGASIGGGALGVYRLTTDFPVAYFRISSPRGWFEPTGTNYNPAWWTNTPTRRGDVVRPFTTPETIGLAPVVATFNAEKSISGVGGSTTHTDLSRYTWDFGDGNVLTTNAPVISHRFTTSGDRLVKLTVLNTAGRTHTTSNLYRIAGDYSGYRPGAPQRLRLVTTP